MLTTLALIALSQYPQHRIFEQPNLRRLNARAEPTYLEFLPESGAGIPAISHHTRALCDALAAEEPNWNTPVDGGAGNWCLGGDGLAVAGSEVTFATVGTPETVNTPVCPSGLDCLAATGQTVRALQTGTGQASAAAVARASGTGAMTACWWGQPDSSATSVILSHATALNNVGMGWAMYWASGLFYAEVCPAISASCATRTVSGIQPGAPAFLCLTHPGTSSVVTSYVNGAGGTAGVASVKGSVVAKPTLSGTNGASAEATVDNNFGAFYVDKELSAAQIAAIARRVLADNPKAVIQGGKSYVDLTYSRTGSMFCSREDNTGSIIPANRPCIARNGILVEGAATNLALRSQELTTSPWVLENNVGVSCGITQNYGTAPDGTKTAERFVAPATSGGQFCGVYQGTAPTGTLSTISFYVKGVSSSGVIPSLMQVGGVYVNENCAYTADAWTRCTRTATPSIVNWGIGSWTNYNPPGFTNAGFDVLLWGAQAELGAVATSYIPTTSAAATRGAVTSYVTHGQTKHDTGCIAATQQWIAPKAGCGGPLALGGLGAHQQSLIFCPNLNAYVAQSLKISVTPPPTTEDSRYVFSYSPSETSLVLNGVRTAGAGGVAQTTTVLTVGRYQTGAADALIQPGWYSKIQYDTRPTRCR